MQIDERIYLVGAEQFGLSHLLDCNCYLIDAPDALILVDAGTGLGVADILDNIHRDGFQAADLSHILVTHAHLGHWGGAAEIREKTGAQIWAPADGQFLMEHIEEDRTIWQNFEFGRYPDELKPEACTPDHTFGDGERLPLGGAEIETIAVQGHTKDSTCFLWETEGKRVLFSGDVVFYAGMLGINNAPGASLEDYRRDMPKLADQRIDLLLPGHSVFILRNGQKHIDRAIRKLSDFVLPDTFFESNEFMWEKDYRSSLE